MARRPSISIVGAGNLATGLAGALRKAGYKFDEVVTQARASSARKGKSLAKKLGSRAETLASARLDANVLIIAAPDDAIASCAAAIAKRGFSSGVVLHCSGALASDALRSLAKAGAATGAMHPLMSFVAGKSPRLGGVLFSVEGDRRATAVASRMAGDIGGVVFPIDKKKKAIYHTFGAFTSPLLIAHLSAAEALARAAGVPRKEIRNAMRPIVERTLDNYFRNGAERAFSGPLVRGDVDTIRKHLLALRRLPVTRKLYIALGLQAIAELPVGQRAAIAKLLKR